VSQPSDPNHKLHNTPLIRYSYRMKTKLLRMLTSLSVLRSFIMDWSLQELLNGLASKWYRLFSAERAERGDAGAQFNLGVRYDQGLGVLQDFKEAAKWYRLSAEQGDAIAQCNLGGMYNEGKGVPQDYKEAVKWWKLAAGQHDEQAQFILERMHGNSSN